MKKTFAFILAALYFTATTGANIQLHFCMGKLIGKDVLTTSKKNCSKCGMEKKEKSDAGCCKDELKFFKVDKDQKVTEDFSQTQRLSLKAVSFSKITGSENIVTSQVHSFPKSNGPPPLTQIAIYKRNCIFLI